jgi:3-dehydroquinate dehydratase/shikimate dehydrogenase
MTQVVVPLSNSEPRFLIELSRQAKAAGADLVEVRMDLCLQEGGSPGAIIDVLAALALPVIVTLRHGRENGAWNGGEDERLALYDRADAAGAAWIDRELVFHAERPWRPRRAKLILSSHDFSGPGVGLADKITAMRTCHADIAKIAVTPLDAADLDGIRRLIDGQGPVAAMAMGEHGLPSRLLAGVWGSALVFARLPGDAGSAPGQPTTDDLLGMCRLRAQGPATAVYGVIGSPIAHSLSPLIHNLAFAHHGLDAVYAPFRVEDAPAFWDACGRWLSGLSITIPHKHVLQGRMEELEPLCDLVGAMNTVYRREGRLTGANTDADAIRRCGERAVDGLLTGKRVLVLGAGGAGRAAAYALKAAGANVAVANRTSARAIELAREVGVRAVPWEATAGEAFDLLVNMTAVGLKAPQDTPWPQAFPTGSGVFDSVYNPLETRLIRDAAAAGCRTVLGLDMFIDQAVAQFRRWTGLEAPAEAMRSACLTRLAQPPRS